MFSSKKAFVSKEHMEYLRKIKLRKLFVVSTQIILVILLFVLWEVAANLKLIDSFITSQPSRIIKTFSNLYNEGQLFKHIGVTCAETAIGFLLGTLLGTMAAIVLWWSDFLSKVMDPYLIVLNSLPKIALGPIFIVWIGAGPAAIVVMAMSISIVVTILEVLNGLQSVDKDKIKLVKTFGASKPFNWSMMAKNLDSEEKIKIDKSDFTSNDYNVPMFVEYVPTGPKISDNNILVYSKTIPNGDKIASVLVCYDLDTKTKKILDRTEDVTKELIHSECTIYDNKIAWSKFHELNAVPYEKRFTRYVYGDIFIYNLNKEEIEQLTFDDYVMVIAQYWEKEDIVTEYELVELK